MHYEISPSGEQQKRFMQPNEVVHQAFAQYQVDGSVLIYDDETDAWHDWTPDRPIDLENLPSDLYAHHLIHASRTISRAIMAIGEISARLTAVQEQEVKWLALALSRYRHDRVFISKAASLIGVEGSVLHPPHLPSGNPWRWVPEFRSSLPIQG